MVQNWPFSHLSSLGNIGQENVFYDILERKKAFLEYKNKKFKKSKNWHFSKGVGPWFWSKIGHFSTLFFLGNIGQENVFYDILERKNAFLGYKNKKFKKSKNWNFSIKVSPWFWSKIGHFSTFFIGSCQICFFIKCFSHFDLQFEFSLPKVFWARYVSVVNVMFGNVLEVTFTQIKLNFTIAIIFLI